MLFTIAKTLRAEADRVEQAENAAIDPAIIEAAIDTCEAVIDELSWKARSCENAADADELEGLYLEINGLVKDLEVIDLTDWDSLDYLGFLAQDIAWQIERREA